jgi:hypothetical protein
MRTGAIMSTRSRLAGGVLLLVMPFALAAQPTADQFSLHGSLNAGYGKSSAVPVIGIPTEGTSDYRIATLQFRYKVADNDQFVMQVLNRRVGTSPLRGAIGDLTTQWAFWQHDAGAFTVKFGRSPLPRGLLNEVRYIGTLLPFFRAPYEFTYDAFDAVDGVVGSYRKQLNDSWRFEGHSFLGGSENRNVRSEATGLSVRISKANNMRGGQLYLSGPFGTKLGLYGDRYERIDETTQLKGSRRHHAFSGEIDRQFVTVRAEHMRETGTNTSSDLRNTYIDVIGKPSDHWRIALEHSIGDQIVFPSASPAAKIPAVRSTGASINYLVSANAVLKFEHHWRRGYQFDAFVPPTQTVSGATVVLPSAYTNYYIASVAFSF